MTSRVTSRARAGGRDSIEVTMRPVRVRVRCQAHHHHHLTTRDTAADGAERALSSFVYICHYLVMYLSKALMLVFIYVDENKNVDSNNNPD